jgi:hypothetical protein
VFDTGAIPTRDRRIGDAWKRVSVRHARRAIPQVAKAISVLRRMRSTDDPPSLRRDETGCKAACADMQQTVKNEVSYVFRHTLPPPGLALTSFKRA